MASAQPGLYSARPAVLVGGQERQELSDGILGLMVAETSEGLYRCELTLGNWGGRDGGDVDYLYYDRDLLDFGKELEIRAGAGDAAGTIFKGKITGLEGRFLVARPPQILVLAEDRLQELRMTRRTRTFADVTDSDIFQTVAREHSLQAAVDVASAVTHRVAAQVNQSDLAFLRERARAVDAEVWMEGDTLHVQARSRRSQGDVRLAYKEQLQEFAVLADLTGQRSSVTVTGWDVSAKDGIAEAAADAAIQSEITAGSSGAQALSAAFGQRKEQLAHMAPLTDAEARALAESRYRRSARRFVTGAGVTEGDSRIKVGCYVDLSGLGPMFSGKYYVAEVRHLFDGERGYRTHFRVERPWIGD